MKRKNKNIKYGSYLYSIRSIKPLPFIAVLLSTLIMFTSCTKNTADQFKDTFPDIEKLEHDNMTGLDYHTLSLRTILAPQNINNASGHFFVDFQTLPANTPYMVIRWQDDTNHTGNAISQNVSYDPGNYTGYTPPSPRSSWQRGEFDDPVSVSPVFQLNGLSGGIMMNSWFGTWSAVVGGGPNVVYGYNFSPYPHPWTTSASKLWVQSDLKLPWFAHWDNNSNGNFPVGQLSFVIYLLDSASNTPLAIIANVFDNRANPSEHVSYDGATHFVGTYLGATRYLTPDPYSATWQTNTWNTSIFCRAQITRQNLINIVTDINDKYGLSLSSNPDNYVLTMAGIIQETFREQGDQISMGSSFYGFGIFEAY